jgi:uncharacterized membrane protein affecting hemolysin expression
MRRLQLVVAALLVERSVKTLVHWLAEPLGVDAAVLDRNGRLLARSSGSH